MNKIKYHKIYENLQTFLQVFVQNMLRCKGYTKNIGIQQKSILFQIHYTGFLIYTKIAFI